ncbi:NAD(P)-binding domain-containing protein [Streptomyces sp. NPDC057367]|uniref:lactate/malate family dehydrogenase n=1 Tax=Streptomyces sp. NPDC057367 TaxID=3346108 RepID=UPI003644C961
MTPAPVDTVGVIGAGAVGQTVVATLLASGLPGRLLVASRVLDQAAALATDLDDMRHTTASPTRVEACEVRGLADSTAVIVAVRAAFTNTNTANVRMAGATANAPAIRALATSLRGYQGTVLVVTNPVDLMTRLFAETPAARACTASARTSTPPATGLPSPASSTSRPRPCAGT